MAWHLFMLHVKYLLLSYLQEFYVLDQKYALSSLYAYFPVTQLNPSCCAGESEDEPGPLPKDCC